MYSEYSFHHLPDDDYADTAPIDGCLTQFATLFLAILVCALLTMLFGCGTVRTAVVQARDSTVVQMVTQTIYVPDTQYVTLPLQTVERITPDTTSTLRTDYAESTAALRAGLLHHTLRTLNTPVPIPVQHRETTRDSIVFREREVPVPVPVEVEVEKPLTRWQQARLHFANIILIALSVSATVWLIRKRA